MSIPGVNIADTIRNLLTVNIGLLIIRHRCSETCKGMASKENWMLPDVFDLEAAVVACRKF
jgi:aspartate carbamoyltransferase catalytic subunit